MWLATGAPGYEEARSDLLVAQAVRDRSCLLCFSFPSNPNPALPERAGPAHASRDGTHVRGKLGEACEKTGATRLRRSAQEVTGSRGQPGKPVVYLVR